MRYTRHIQLPCLGIICSKKVEEVMLAALPLPSRIVENGIILHLGKFQ
jgi:hypothetical protein